MNDEKKIAQAILDAQRYREESWVDDPTTSISHDGGYRLGILECLKTACEKQNLSSNLYQLLYLAVEAWWNDTEEWATKVLANKE